MSDDTYDREFARVATRNEIGQSVYEAMLRTQSNPRDRLAVAAAAGCRVVDVIRLQRGEHDSIGIAADCLAALGYRMHITITPWHEGVRKPAVEEKP